MSSARKHRDPFSFGCLFPLRPLVAGLLLSVLGVVAPQGAAAQFQDTVEEPFRGLTDDGEPRSGLFPVRATGVSTEPVVEAARRYLGSLTAEQRAQATFPLESDEWRHWANYPQLDRRGLSFRDMDRAQREAAYDLIRAGLSAKGFRQARDIMRVAGWVQELMDDEEIYGEHLYFLNVLGEPSSTEPWGWQLDGYHLVVNYFVLGDQVVMTPAFWGIEPAQVEEGPLAGTEVLQPEQDRALQLMRSLGPDQRRQARIGTEKTENNLLAGAFQDNLELEYAGISASQLDGAQRDRLLELIGLYVRNLREGHAEIRMEEVREHLEETHFAWLGGTGPDALFYYRIQSPVILIEFDHTVPVVLREELGGEPSRQHIHSVVRTPNGNDYGKDLLRQHYEAHADDPDHSH